LEKGIIGKKIGMTQIFDEKGKVIPVTVIEAGPCPVVMKKTLEKDGGLWGLIDAVGSMEALPQFSNIKLDLNGAHIRDGVILAKEEGRYGVYGADFNRISEFSCDDIDIYTGGGHIAFYEGGAWGFADAKGKIAAEPQYAGAKSFSNGYAAVANRDGLWGFIDKNFNLVIDHKYVFAHYFTGDRTCIVSEEEGKYRILRFMF